MVIDGVRKLRGGELKGPACGGAGGGEERVEGNAVFQGDEFKS